MSIRRDPIYVSNETWRALWLLAKSRSGQDDQGLHTVVTPDEMADKLLRESLTALYPQIFEHAKAVQKMERELIKTLGGGK